LKVNFDYYQSLENKLSYEEWKKEALKRVSENGRHYAVLSDLLKELEFEFPPLTEKDLDFRH
jgi:hypothetical protein